LKSSPPSAKGEGGDFFYLLIGTRGTRGASAVLGSPQVEQLAWTRGASALGSQRATGVRLRRLEATGVDKGRGV